MILYDFVQLQLATILPLYFNSGSSRQFSPAVFEVRLGMGLSQTEKAVASKKISIFLGVPLIFYSEKINI
jgi:hypothetical protein